MEGVAKTEIEEIERDVIPQERIKETLMETRKEFEEKLSKAKEKFKEEIRARDKVTKNHPADHNNTYVFGDSRVNHLIKCLQKIDEAIKRVDQGTYGICEECGRLIPQARLKIAPFTRHCVPCKNSLK
jgi:DnaK suppressor protein